jgi:hypothetical protein
MYVRTYSCEQLRILPGGSHVGYLSSCFSPYGATTHSCGVPPRSFGFTPLAASSLVAGPMGRRRRGM